MEFRNLKKQYCALEEQIDSAIKSVMQRSAFIGGSEISELEKMLAEYVGVPYCICCANGTDALKLALMAWGIGPGDAVFVPDFTFFSSGEVVADLGATPVFVDVCEDSFNIDVIKLERMIQKVLNRGELRPRVIMPVDLFGLPADYLAIRDIASKYGLRVLEDGAQGFGGMIGERRACSFGDIATTSFFPAKPLGCYGDGGAVFVHSQEEYRLIRSFQVHGKGENKYDNVRIGMNSRLDTIQAAILKVKLRAFSEDELQKVNHFASMYTERLNECVAVPVIAPFFYSSWAQYTIKLKNLCERNELQNYLKGQEIPTMVYYPKPMHRQKAFENKSWQYDESDYEVTNSLCERVLALPISPYIEGAEIDLVVTSIKSFFE